MRFIAVTLVLCGLAAPLTAQADFELQGPPCMYVFPSPMGAGGDPEGVSVNAIAATTARIDTISPCSGVQNLSLGNGFSNGTAMPNPVAGVPPTTLTNAEEAYIPVPAGITAVSFCWNGWAGDGIGNGTFNDGIMIDIIDVASTQLSVLVYRDVFSDPGTMVFGSTSNCLGNTKEEFSPAGLKTVSMAPLPPGAAYIRVAAWSGFDFLVPATVAVDGFTFGQGPAFDHSITCVPSGPLDSDVVVSIVGGGPSAVVYLAMTVNNVGTAPAGWFYGIDITLQEIQAQIVVGNPWVDVLDAAGNFNIVLTALGVSCPLGIGIDSVPVEFAPLTGVVLQAGPAHTFNL